MRRLAALLAVPLLACGALSGCGTASSGREADGRAGDRAGASASSSPTGDPAPPTVAARAAPNRTYPVASRTLRLERGARRLAVTLWYPARAGGAQAADGRFPVVVFSHGLGAVPGDYRQLLRRWAAAGFVVAAPAYPGTTRGGAGTNVLDVLNQPADASFVLTRVLALDTTAGDPLRGRLDGARVGAAGHSAGGVTTVGLFTSFRDSRLRGGIVLAGSALGVGTGFAGPAAPLLFVHGDRDEVVAYADGHAAFDAVPWPKAMLTLRGAGHGQGLGDGAAFDAVAATTVDFLRWSLYGDPRARDRLPGHARAGGVARLDNRL